jgi:hypothetical protein
MLPPLRATRRMTDAEMGLMMRQRTNSADDIPGLASPRLTDRSANASPRPFRQPPVRLR